MHHALQREQTLWPAVEEVHHHVYALRLAFVLVLLKQILGVFRPDGTLDARWNFEGRVRQDFRISSRLPNQRPLWISIAGWTNHGNIAITVNGIATISISGWSITGRRDYILRSTIITVRTARVGSNDIFGNIHCDDLGPITVMPVSIGSNDDMPVSVDSNGDGFDIFGNIHFDDFGVAGITSWDKSCAYGTRPSEEPSARGGYGATSKVRA